MTDDNTETYPRILIIDDDPALVKVLRRLLEFESFEVVEAENGKTGLKLVEEMAFDLVITDILMPEVDGLEVIQAIKKRFPSQKIIAISGAGLFSECDYLSWAAKLGAEKTFAKPFNLREILAAVYELLEKPQEAESPSE